MESLLRKYGAFEAKTHFSEILMAVYEGEKFIITKHGNAVAMIIPYKNEKTEISSSTKSAIRAIKKMRKGLSLGKKLTIRKMREKGRK